jgi:hypothetical protein
MKRTTPNNLVLLLSLAATLTWAQTPKPQVAVMTFTGDKSSTPEQLEAITERFQAELLGTQQFVILNRSQIDGILREQGFQQSGACNSEECQVKIGQLLGVDKLISGKVVTFGEVYAFNISYLNVGTGVVEKAFSLEIKGALIDVLSTGCKQAADKLAFSNKPASKTKSTKVKVIPLIPVGAKTTNWKWIAVTMDILGASALGYGLYQESQVKSANDAYDNLPAQRTETTYGNAWQKVTDAKFSRNVGYGIGAALLTSGITLHFAF